MRKFLILSFETIFLALSILSIPMTFFSVLVIFLTIFFLSYDYCSNNFGIDLEEEYANYNEKDLIFGKMNICQYAIKKGIIDVLILIVQKSHICTK